MQKLEDALCLLRSFVFFFFFLILCCKLFELQIMREVLKLILVGGKNLAFLFLPFA